MSKKLLTLVMFLVVSQTGCQSDTTPNPPRTETRACSMCRGSGRNPEGGGCVYCAGRGTYEVSQTVLNQETFANENLRRRERGETPLTEQDYRKRYSNGGTPKHKSAVAAFVDWIPDWVKFGFLEIFVVGIICTILEKKNPIEQTKP